MERNLLVVGSKMRNRNKPICCLFLSVKVRLFSEIVYAEVSADSYVDPLLVEAEEAIVNDDIKEFLD